MKIKKFIKNNKKTLSFVFLLICFSFFLLCFCNRESDYLWHVTAGKYMLDNGTILKNDIFSWYMYGKEWMSHEWLFEIIIAFLRNVFGNIHLLIYLFICSFSLISILFFTNKKSYLKNTVFSLGWIIGLFVILYGFIQGRPHMISFSFLALTIYLYMDLFKNENSKKIYFIPLLSIIWSNVHGGSSSLVYLFGLVFVFAGIFKFKFSKIEASRISKKQIIKYFIIIFLSMIGICINPHGISMLIYPYMNMADNLMISNITEWQPTVLSELSHYVYFILVFIIVMILLLSKKKIKFIDLLLFGVTLFMGLKSVRFWPYIYIVMSYVIFDYIPDRKDDKGTNLIICVLGCLLLGIFIGNYNSIDLEKSILSDKMISTIKKESPDRLYNMYNYGGELIYNDIFVFIDGRADLYSKYNYKDYLNISYLESDYVELINKYNFDYFLVDSDYPIYTYLKYNDEYELIEYYKNSYLYKKKGLNLK